VQFKATTYEQYLELAAGAAVMDMEKEANHLVEKFRLPSMIQLRFAPVTYVLDYSTGKYLFVDEGCFSLLGYTAAHFLETGLKEYISKWHPSEYELLNSKIFTDNYNFLKTLPLEKYADYIFSYSYRFLNPDGDYLNLIQRYSYVPGNSMGNPVGAIGVIFDITHFKSDYNVIHTIEEFTRQNNMLVNKLVYKKVHPVYEIPTQQLMSKRELEVLMYMAEGLSSKQIASKLGLSINTVNNHRKNMLHKMNCKSSSELLSYAIKYGLLCS
jgi:DNA-binding CsgD family transcriptional regulator